MAGTISMGGRDCQYGQGLSVWEAGAISMGPDNPDAGVGKWCGAYPKGN